MKLATLFNKLTKNKNIYFNVFILLGIVVLVIALLQYNNKKMSVQDSMANNIFANAAKVEGSDSADVVKEEDNKPDIVSGAQPVSTTDGNQFLNVNGLSSGNKPKNTCNNQPVMDPKELLPSDSNNEWSNIMPNNDLKNIGMLNAGHHVGINTVGSSLRNANLQIRSEPVIPQTNIGPWNNTTIEADNLRRPLEIGASE